MRWRREAALLLVLVACVGAEGLPEAADLRLGFVSGYLQDRVHTIDFTPSGERFLAAGWKRAASFATEDGAPLGDLPTERGAQVLDAQWIDGGAAVLSVVASRGSILQAETGALQRVFGGEDVFVAAARLSNKGGLVAIGGQRRSLAEAERASLVRVYARDSGALVHELEMSGRSVADLAFSPSDDALLVASNDPFLRLYDLATGRELHRYGGRALEPEVIESEADRLDPARVRLEFVAASFSPGGEEVLGLALRHSLSRWSRKDGRLLAKVEAVAPGVSEAAADRLPVTTRRVGMGFYAASSDGIRAVVHSQDLKLINLHTGSVERALDFPAGVPSAAAFTPDGRSVVVGGSRGLCFRYDVETGEIVGRDKEVRGAVVELALRPGSAEVLAGDLRFLRRWRLADGRPTGRAMDHGAPVDVLAVAPGGALAFTGGGAPGGKVWTLGSDRLEVALDLGGGEPVGAYFLDPSRLLVVARSGEGRVFALPAAEADQTFTTGDGARVTALSPEGDVLALVGGGELRFFDLEGLRILARFPFEGAPKGMAFAPDGTTVAVGLVQRDLVRRYDIGGGELAPLVLRKKGETIPTRHPDDTRAGSWEVAFTPQGDRLVARSAGRALQVWAHPQGRRLGHVKGSVLNAVTGMVVDDEGRAISGAGKVAYRWKLGLVR